MKPDQTSPPETFPLTVQVPNATARVQRVGTKMIGIAFAHEAGINVFSTMDVQTARLIAVQIEIVAGDIEDAERSRDVGL